MFGLSIIAFSQTNISIGTGYSWLNGVVSAEAQLGNFGIGAGWFPAKMPLSREPVSSFSASLTYYGKTNEFLNQHKNLFDFVGVTYYGSIGVASAGYRYEDNSLINEIVEPMTIGMIGLKSHIGKFGLKIGGGYGWCQYAGTFTWEAGLQYTLFSNH